MERPAARSDLSRGSRFLADAPHRRRLPGRSWRWRRPACSGTRPAGACVDHAEAHRRISSGSPGRRHRDARIHGESRDGRSRSWRTSSRRAESRGCAILPNEEAHSSANSGSSRASARPLDWPVPSEVDSGKDICPVVVATFEGFAVRSIPRMNERLAPDRGCRRRGLRSSSS
jgi:hypothetical protein